MRRLYAACSLPTAVRYVLLLLLLSVSAVLKQQAIAMEEALPAGVSNAEALAPEEVYTKKRGRDAVFLEGSSEMDQSDRHRARLAKKRVRNQKRRQASHLYYYYAFSIAIILRILHTLVL
jgi:U3 small nucleolar ribonucleoprotein component